jgi:hypothetical protein
LNKFSNIILLLCLCTSFSACLNSPPDERSSTLDQHGLYTHHYSLSTSGIGNAFLVTLDFPENTPFRLKQPNEYRWNGTVGEDSFWHEMLVSEESMNRTIRRGFTSSSAGNIRWEDGFATRGSGFSGEMSGRSLILYVAFGHAPTEMRLDLWTNKPVNIHDIITVTSEVRYLKDIEHAESYRHRTVIEVEDAAVLLARRVDDGSLERIQFGDQQWVSATWCARDPQCDLGLCETALKCWHSPIGPSQLTPNAAQCTGAHEVVADGTAASGLAKTGVGIVPLPREMLEWLIPAFSCRDPGNDESGMSRTV